MAVTIVGWAVWVVLTGLVAVAAAWGATSWFGDRSAPERWAVGVILAVALIIGPTQLAGLFGGARPEIAGPLVGLCACGVLVAVLRRRTWREVAARLAEDAKLPWSTLRRSWPEREVLALAVPFAGLALIAAAVYVWVLRSWNFDSIVYHAAITDLIVQDGSTRHVATHSPWIKGYPVNLSLLAAWNVMFMRDDRLDDSAQLPFALLAALIVAAWCRRLGVSSARSMALGACFLLLPPVLVQLPTAQVDIACGALFAAALYFSTSPVDRRDRWVAFVALGLYLGTKYTGLLHLALLAPLLAFRVALELRRVPGGRGRVMADVGLAAGVLLALGAQRYLENWIVLGNPTWPFRLHVPFTEIVLPGVMDSGHFYEAPGKTGAFFGGNADVQRLISSWFHAEPVYFPDVKQGGFGPLFRWALLPATFVTAAVAFQPSQRSRALPVTLLFGLSIVVPAAWWPRYTFAAAVASLIAFGYVVSQIRWMRARSLAGVLAVALLGFGVVKMGNILWQGRGALYGWPLHFPEAVSGDATTRSAIRIVDWLWPREFADRRERELRAGDVIVYDDSADFIAEYFTHDYRTRTLYVPSDGEPEEFVRRVRELNARWVGVRADSAAEKAVVAGGGKRLFRAPRTGTNVYEMAQGIR